MAAQLHAQALTYLRRALVDPSANFRDNQWEAIEALVESRSRLLVVQRTGWGKSLVYFLATRLLRERGGGPALLISPLLALMRNQIIAAQRLGVNAETINSSNRTDWKRVASLLQANEVDILLISPERLANDEFRQDVLLPMANRIGLFVVDEAHCISDWGHDFRPNYRRISRILQALPPTVPVLATTATANNRVVDDIVGQLGEGLKILRGSLVRESLRLQNIALPKQAARMSWLGEYVPKLPGSGIIYTLTVRDADRIATWLQQCGIAAKPYHSALDAAQRESLEDQLLSNALKALVATTALGMGFDKPDLGFVIHYQRPSSVVHYYQQVGRAGRALPLAYGILLSGEEDDEIAEYFLRTAFPPEIHVSEVLEALQGADNGLTLAGLERETNLARSQITKVLDSLLVTTPAPVSKIGASWFVNPVPYTPDREKIARLISIRRSEQAQMSGYMRSQECLMVYLTRELDDPHLVPCGHCAVCRGRPWLPNVFSQELARAAVQFLRRTDQPILPRKRWRADAMATEGWSGLIAPKLQASVGRALCLWGDDGWGEEIRRGKQILGHFDDALASALAEMVSNRWHSEDSPTWITCIPSLNNPDLVPDLAARLAQLLKLPFVPCVRKVRNTEPQKAMQNSYQQSHNLSGAFAVDPRLVRSGPVLLVDDVVDSRWTFTIVAALLRAAGSGPVLPIALAMATPSEE